MSARNTGPVLAITPEIADGLADIIGTVTGTRPQRLPWLTPVLLSSDIGNRCGVHLPQPEPDEVLIHDYQSIAFETADIPRSELTGSVARCDRGKTAEYDISLSADGIRTVTLKSALRCVSRADVVAHRPVRFTSEQLAGDGTAPVAFRVAQPQIDGYVTLAADKNPIHTDPAEARTLNLPGTVVPGMLMLALLQALMPTAPLRDLKGRFMAPLCVDEPFQITRVSRGAGACRAFFHADDGRALALVNMQTAT